MRTWTEYGFAAHFSFTDNSTDHNVSSERRHLLIMTYIIPFQPPVTWCHDNVKTIHAIYCVWNDLGLIDQRHYILVVALVYQEGEVYLHTQLHQLSDALCWKKIQHTGFLQDTIQWWCKSLSLPTAHGWIRHGCMTMLDTTTVNLGFKINTCILSVSTAVCLAMMTWGFAYQWWHKVLPTKDDTRFCLPMMTWGFAYQWRHEVFL